MKLIIYRKFGGHYCDTCIKTSRGWKSISEIETLTLLEKAIIKDVPFLIDGKVNYLSAEIN